MSLFLARVTYYLPLRQSHFNNVFTVRACGARRHNVRH